MANLRTEALGLLARGCKHLKALNLSYCGGVNNETLIVVAKACKQLELFHCAFCTDVTDAGVYALQHDLCPVETEILDVSFCASLSDDGVSAVAERCAALEYLNLSGLHRVTDAAALRVTHNLWRLRTLCLEDLHLITDAIFFFDAKKDGRAAASSRCARRPLYFFVVPSICSRRHGRRHVQRTGASRRLRHDAASGRIQRDVVAR